MLRRSTAAADGTGWRLFYLHTADDNFDPLYFVEGTEAALEDLFTAAVRAAFVMIARREPVVADIANAIVTIELKTQPLREACAFVTALQ